VANPYLIILVSASAVGLVTYLLAFGVVRKSRKDALRCFLPFFSFFNAAILLSTITAFLQAFLEGHAQVYALFFLAGRSIFLLCVSYLILFLQRASAKKTGRVFYLFIASAGLVILAYSAHLYLASPAMPSTFFDVTDAVLDGAIIYAIFSYLFSRKGIKDPVVAGMIRPIVLITMLFLPLIVADDFIRQKGGEIVFLFYPVYNLALNLSILHYGYRHLTGERIADGRGPLSDAFVRCYEITPREREVIELMLEGHDTRKIAQELFISPATVKNHMHSILTKTRCPNRVALSALCTRHPL
jgi:Response regulator containing a CheY-like receiver domain and an HTH DNA-binding domain